MMDKKLIKACISIILSFILFAAIACLIICFSFKSTWLNSDFMRSKMEAANYYNLMYSDILNDYESIGIPSGIPVEVFVEALELSDIKRDINNGIKCLYTNQTHIVEIEVIKSNLQNAFAQYAVLINSDIHDESVQEALNKLEDYCISRYINQVKLPLANQISPYIVQALKYINYATIGFLILSLLCLTGLVIVKRFHSIKYLGSSLISGGLICVIPCLVAILSAPYKRLNLGSTTFHKFLIQFVQSGLQSIFITGIVIMIWGIFLVITWGVWVSKKQLY